MSEDLMAFDTPTHNYYSYYKSISSDNQYHHRYCW